MVNPVYEDQAPVQPADPSVSRIEIPVEYAPVEFRKEPAVVRLRPMFAKAKADAQATEREADRQADKVSFPDIKADIERTVAHQREIQSEIEKVQSMLSGQQQPQYQEPTMSLAQMIATGVSGLVGGAQGFNQAAGGFQDRNEKTALQRYKEAQMAHETERENLLNHLRLLAGDEDTAQRMFQTLQSRQWSLEDQQAEAARKATQDAATDRSNLTNRFLQANTPDEKQFVGRQLVALGLISEEEVNAAVKDMVDQRRNARRDAIYRAAMPYIKTDEDRTKLTNWMLNMSDEELNLVAGKSEVERSQMALAALRDAKTKTEDAMRGPKVEKVKAEVKSILAGANLKDEQAALYHRKVAAYPLEMQARVANIYSQIEKRNQEVASGGGKPEKYYGAGLETGLKQMQRLAQDAISKFGVMGDGASQEDFTAAMNDFQYATQELEKIAAAKAEYAKTENTRRHGGGGGTRPRSSIDTSGGFAPMSPNVPGVTDSPFSGARAGAGTPKAKGKPKPKPKPQPKTNKTRSGTSYEFIPD